MFARPWRHIAASVALVAAPIAASPGTFAGGGQTYAVPARPVRTHQLGTVRRPRPQLATYCSTNVAFVGGGFDNVAGGINSGILDGQYNEACDQLSGIGVGNYNVVYNNGTNGAEESFIAGGDTNFIGSYRSFIGSGDTNTIEYDHAFIGAGTGGYINSPLAFIGAGTNNTIDTTGTESFLGAGNTNLQGGNDSFLGDGANNTVGANYAFLGAGNQNKIFSGADYSVIGGGATNTVTGAYATVPGGYGNTATGIASFAAGTNSDARSNGAFVWSDDAAKATQLKSFAANQFLVRASGGVKFYTNATLTSGVQLPAGSGAWASLSDRTMKTRVVALDDAAILDKVAALPVSEWSYTSERGVRHVGPMAQDFYAAFGVGEDDRHITSIDEDGVALSAIKALRAQNRALEQRLAHLQAQVDALVAASAHR